MSQKSRKEGILEEILVAERDFLQIQNSVGGCTIIVDSDLVFAQEQPITPEMVNNYAAELRFEVVNLIHSTLGFILSETCPLHPDQAQYFVHSGDPKRDDVLTSYQHFVIGINSNTTRPGWLKLRKK